MQIEITQEQADHYNSLFKRAISLVRPHLILDEGREVGEPGWLARRRLRKGITLLEQALAIAPFKWECRFWIGKALQRLGDRREALTWFGDALRQEPGNATVALEAANEALELGEYEVAVAFLRPATALEPSHAALHHNLAVALLLAGRPRDALQAVDLSAGLKADARAAWLRGWIEDVLAGRRPVPHSMAELRRGA